MEFQVNATTKSVKRAKRMPDLESIYRKKAAALSGINRSFLWDLDNKRTDEENII